MSTSRELYVEKMNHLEDLILNDEGCDYMTESVYRIYKSLIEHEQFSDFRIDEPICAKKLVRCYKYVENYVLDLKGVQRIVIGGLFVEADLYMIPIEMLRKIRKKDYYLSHPEMYGLLPSTEVNYGTLKEVNGMAVALMKNSWTDGIIQYASQYDYVTLD